MSGLPITLTSAGLQELINASSNGTAAVTISAIGVTQTPFTPDPSLTAVPSELERLTTVSGQVVAPDTIHVSVQDNSSNAYNVFGFGLYLADGTLFGAYSQAELIVGKTASSIMLLAIDIQLAAGDAASVAFGSAEFVDPPASETTVGVSRFATAAEAIAGALNSVGVHPAGLLAALEAFLPFTPVQQGGGASQGTNKIFLGWDAAASRLRLQVDTTDSGDLALLTDVTAAVATINQALAGKQASLGFTPVNRAGDTMTGPLRTTIIGWGSGGTMAGGEVQADVNLTDLRIYEIAGSERGVFVDISQCAAGAGSELWHSGNFSPASKLSAANNLSDLTSVPTALGNLGIGPLGSIGVGGTAAQAVVDALGFTPAQEGGVLAIGLHEIKLGWDGVRPVFDIDNGGASGELATGADLSAIDQALAGKQAALGFTPVGQGGALATGAHVIKLGWDGTRPVYDIDTGAASGELATGGDVSALTQALAGKQPSLGFTPVQQGGGANQAGNKVILGWDAAGNGHLRLQVDSVDQGDIAMVGDLATGNVVASGWVRNNTGWTECWGFAQGPFSEQTVQIAFPITFSDCFGCFGWVVNNAADVTIDTRIDEVGLQNNGATMLVNRESTSSPNIQGFRWRAFGLCESNP